MKRAFCSALSALLLAAAPASAGLLADLHVISRSTGQRLPVYAHGGRLYVAGQPGERYSVQVVNRTNGRILSVVSVDGINVVTGETAAHDQSGYVFSPRQSYEIAGWRKNVDEVAAFYFTALPDSYAARTDRPGNVGVIGVAVFREWAPPRSLRHPRPYDSAESGAQDNAGARRAEETDSRPGPPSSAAHDAERAAAAPMAKSEKLGTGHGEREHSAVTFTDFRRASPGPNEMLTLYYDRYENLVARGVIPGRPLGAQPQPFPASMRFAPDPRS